MTIRRLIPVIIGIVMVSAAAPAAAQNDSRPFRTSAYLPLDHWAYPYINTLLARGGLEGLPLAVQPYRRVDIATSVANALESDDLSGAEREWLQAISQELEYETSLVTGRERQELRFATEVSGGVNGVSQRHRDVLRPEGDEALWPVLGLNLSADAPAIAAAFDFRWDRHYINDPQFPGGRVNQFRECDPIVAECSYRVEEGYIEVQLPYVRLSFGRMYRNWAVPGTRGLLLSDYAYSYDHIGYQFGTSKLSMSGMFTPLADFGTDTTRYLAMHRLDWQIRDNLLLSLSESVIWGGEGAKLDFNIINPIGIWEINPQSGTAQRNTLGLVELWWRPFGNLITHGSLLVDNTRVGEEGEKGGLTQYAAAFGVQIPRITPTFALRGDFSVVSSLAYRSRIGDVEYYAVDGIGLAHDLTDALTYRLTGDWLVSPHVFLNPGVTVMRRGTANLRQAWPEDAFTTYDPLLVGTVETTIRPALGGQIRFPYGEVTWDAGINFVKNVDNMDGNWETKGVANTRIMLRKRFSSIIAR
jgi:hypothetical protein